MARQVFLFSLLLVFTNSATLGLNHVLLPENNEQSRLQQINGILHTISGIYGDYEGRLRGLNSEDTATYEEIHEHALKDDKAIAFDFIIVGAGSAGAVLANRLSEIPDWRILLIEAGYQGSSVGDIPAFAPVMFFTDYNWNYYMEKADDFGLGLINQSMAWPRGKGLGGTSLINYMIHTRGNSKDYDRWADLGNPGWSYKEVLPYFIKSEDFLGENGDKGFHRRGGNLGVQHLPYRTESAHAFVRAAQELGLNIVDYNGKTQMGVSYVQGTLRRGLRCSTEKAFLRPARPRPNLKIITGARATKVLIDPDTKEATGVEFYRNGRYFRAKAEKEVILSAGAFHSPQLLMLSGIGPKKQLEDLGIEVIKEAPVGQKLYDHICFMGMFFSLNESITVDGLNSQFNPEAYLEILGAGRGPLTLLGGSIEALAYIKTEVSADADDYPDMELIFFAGGFHTDGGLFQKDSWRLSDEVYNVVYKQYEGRPGYTIFPMLVHPKSFGHLELRSKDPFAPPKLYGNYFSDPDGVDLKTLIASIRAIQKMGQSASFLRYGSRLVTTKIPGCEKHEFDTDEYWECALRHVTVTVHHQVATCKMGPENDAEAIVDADLKVYGIKNLRIADTSIIPIPLTAHTNVPAIMIGEKASDIIKMAWDEPIF